MIIIRSTSWAVKEFLIKFDLREKKNLRQTFITQATIFPQLYSLSLGSIPFWRKVRAFSFIKQQIGLPFAKKRAKAFTDDVNNVNNNNNSSICSLK